MRRSFLRFSAAALASLGLSDFAIPAHAQSGIPGGTPNAPARSANAGGSATTPSGGAPSPGSQMGPPGGNTNGVGGTTWQGTGGGAVGQGTPGGAPGRVGQFGPLGANPGPPPSMWGGNGSSMWGASGGYGQFGGSPMPFGTTGPLGGNQSFGTTGALGGNQPLGGTFNQGNQVGNAPLGSPSGDLQNGGVNAPYGTPGGNGVYAGNTSGMYTYPGGLGRAAGNFGGGYANNDIGYRGYSQYYGNNGGYGMNVTGNVAPTYGNGYAPQNYRYGTGVEPVPTGPGVGNLGYPNPVTPGSYPAVGTYGWF